MFALEPAVQAGALGPEPLNWRGCRRQPRPGSRLFLLRNAPSTHAWEGRATLARNVLLRQPLWLGVQVARVLARTFPRRDFRFGPFSSISFKLRPVRTESSNL